MDKLEQPEQVIQHTTFVNWCNVYLNQRNMAVKDLMKDLAQSLNLINLLEILSGKSFSRYNKSPRTNDEHKENLQLALAFMKDREQISMRPPTVEDIMNGVPAPILGMIWALVMFYDIQLFHKRPREDRATAQPSHDVLLDWVNSQNVGVNNFEKDWQNGRKLYNLVFAFEPGALPRQPSSDDPRTVAAMALEAAAQRLHVPTIISAEHLTSPHSDAISIMTYIAGFRKAVTTMDDLERPAGSRGRPSVYDLNESEIQSADAGRPLPAQQRQPSQRPSQRASQSQLPPPQRASQSQLPQQQQQPQPQRLPSVPMRTVPVQQSSRGYSRPSQRAYEQPQQPARMASGSHYYESMWSQQQQAGPTGGNQLAVRSRSSRGPPVPQPSASQYSIALAGWNGDFVVPTAGGPSARTFPVNLLELADFNRLGRRGPMWLQVTLDDIALLDQNSGALLYAWPLNHIKRYGKDVNVFSMEIGSLNRNAGIFFFETPTSDDVFAVVKSYVNAW
eukprot:m.118343 g.118343  ORF g.118343 m.118343 type:complete len:504 (-) comp16115_c0_seq3:477-1988(-)